MKQVFKKTLAVILAILLVLPTVCFGSFAEPTVTAGKAVASCEEIRMDEPLTVSFALEGNTREVGSAQMALFYNSSAFAYVDSSAQSDYFTQVTVRSLPDRSAILLSAMDGEKTLAAGNVFSCTFLPTSSAVAGEDYVFSFGNADTAVLNVTTRSSGIAEQEEDVILSSGTAEDGAIYATVKVKILENTYTVTYTDGVSSDAIFEDQIYTVGEGKPTPAFSGGIPQREGYVFDGWEPAVAETVTSDAVYSAAWTKTWQIVYTDGVEGEELFPDQVYTVREGDPVPAYSGAIPERPGYTFTEWIISSSSAIADMQIVPLWSRNPVYYSVTYTDGVEDEEVFPDQTVSVTESSATPAFSSGIASSAVPLREGYVFDGWEPAVAETVTSDAVYSAKWKMIITVIYNDGVSDEEIFPDQVYQILEGEQIPIFIGTPAREGYVFLGWNIPSGAISPKVTITPDWQKLPTFTVTYKDGAEKTVFADQTYTVVVGSATPAFSSGIASSAVPVREGYLFDGWTPAVVATVTTDTVYTATWIKTYTVTYTDGVASEAIFADQIYVVVTGSETPAFSSGIASSATPQRPGYRFDGWTPAVAATVTSDAVYTAAWIKIITVTYTDGVDGAEIFPDQTYLIEEGDPIPAYNGPTPDREGYLFLGWNVPSGAVTEDLTIVPNWRKLPTFSVTYTDGAGGTVFADQVCTVVVNGKTPAFSSGIPTRIGYVFDGWTPEIMATVTADIVYTAKWLEGYTVVYTDGVADEAVFEDQWYSVLPGSATPAFSSGIPSSAVPVRAGYVFDGWTPAVAETVTSDAVYAAAWKKRITVTYTDGVENEELFPDRVYEILEGGQVPAYEGTEPVRYGYVFRGWNIPSGAVYADTVITPVWEALPAFTVTYTDGTGSAAIFADQVYTVIISSATPAFSSGIPQRPGFTFEGWSPAVADIVTSDAVYTATWLAVAPPAPTEFTVIFRTDAAASAAVTVESGAAVQKPAVPEKSGCGFAGWYLDEAYTQKYDFSAPVTGDTVLYARFFMWGDVNCDGFVDSFDANLINAYVMEVDNPQIRNIMAGAVHGVDGFVSSFDANLIQQYVMEAIDLFPVESYAGYEFDIEKFTVISPQEN